MSREEANRLSSLRRDELRKNRELESNRALRIKNMLKVRLFNLILVCFGFRSIKNACLNFELLTCFSIEENLVMSHLEFKVKILTTS